MRRSLVLLSAGLTVLSAGFSTGPASAENNTPRNLILFIPDGLRALKVTPETAPAMAEIRDKGVNFKNSHSLFPTFTMANGSAMSTGHYLGDTGVFSNTIWTNYTSVPAGDTVVPFIENDAVLGDIDEHFKGDYLNEDTILKLARDKGYSTAALGKHGPTYQFDHTDKPEKAGLHSVVFDDATGGKNGVALSDEVKAALTKAGLPLATPPRGDNSKAGDAKTPGTTAANVAQQAYFADVAAKVVLPMFKARNKPFVLVFWSRDPDGSQHNTGDSLNQIMPGINGPTSMAGIKNADNNLAQLRKALDELGLAATTNIMVQADHGFSTISKESKTSPSAKVSYDDTPKDFLPMGFLALDLAKALDLPLFDPNDKNAKVEGNKHPKAGNGVLGKDPEKPDLVVATNGGSDLIYLPTKDKKLAAKTVKLLLEQDYVSGLFVDDSLGRFPGTLPLSSINLRGKAATPTPAIVVNFRSYASDCGEAPTNCSVQVADTVLRQGQGMHGSFSRGDTMNFMAAVGPDFKAGYVSEIPVSNADVGMTAAQLLGLRASQNGGLVGRVMSEALPNGIVPKAYKGVEKSKKSENGLQTVLNFQRVGSQRYFDTAGFPGRTLGLEPDAGKQKTAGK
ncbi:MULTISPECIES: alkaline phosphatase family protein [Bradyrhizobium]|uniref:alkaline phosphatase family protein n=1 Tax=Bradyrhizobium TaxID=374 RepID=UPI00195CF394|nr:MULTISPECIES: alkaline phosphatase family protein [Bradyrhizobium]MBM7483282.1 putative AlkP superfamily pyrophosphatase or phosphodiesterase [Bradyrhizobium canariense]MCK1322377.1 alkaline phosphatase family protein [Bradyrhizobium sp. 156]MCK1327103.1 alkaline phosphatase family protein [Bradyrhizobium sp. CW9]MCK1412265.1 alkaline phosphatase family protein [Bradyrhizobium sp. CW4]MCK1470481.1 alkaline phosphatase family protein [Bradyrhizobium sp. CW10]